MNISNCQAYGSDHQTANSNAQRHRGPRIDQRQEVNGPTQDRETRFRSSTSGSLSVVTADGDKVTLSFAAQQQLRSTSHQGPDGVSLTQSSSSSSKVQVKVEGNLSDQELKDLTTLISALGNAAGQANQGKSPDVAGLVRSLQQLDTISGFNFQQQQNIEAGSLFRLAA